jgi:hypothetical protein
VPRFTKSALMVGTLVLVAAAVVLFRGPGSAGFVRPTYDGWRVGDGDACPIYPTWVPESERPSADECEANLAVWLGAATDGFDRRDPAHPPVVRVTLHHLATSKLHSANCCEVAVFELADGTLRAIGIAQEPMSSTLAPVDYGPDP